MSAQSNIARPYAHALFELAEEQNDLSGWSNQLALLTIIATDDQIVALINDPRVSSEMLWKLIVTVMMFIERKRGGGKSSPPPDEIEEHELLAFVLELMGDSGKNRQSINFVRLLVRNGRISALPEIAQAYAARKAEAEKVVAAEMVTATPISDSQQEKFTEALRSTLGCNVNLKFEVDEALIGGAVIRAGDWVVDGSVKAQLEQLAGALRA